MVRPTVLLADDDPPIRALLKAVLSRSDYQVLEARTGSEVLEHIRKSQFDVLLLDLMMPGVNGFEVLEHLRTERPEMLRCVIVITAASDKDLARLRSKEIFRVIRKPFDIRDLDRAIAECLRR